MWFMGQDGDEPWSATTCVSDGSMQLLMQDGRPILRAVVLLLVVAVLEVFDMGFILKHRTLLIFFISHTDAAPLVSDTQRYLDLAAFPPNEIEVAAAASIAVDTFTPGGLD
jgi:hypothetical protein